jgi:hypothetical protein
MPKMYFCFIDNVLYIQDAQGQPRQDNRGLRRGLPGGRKYSGIMVKLSPKRIKDENRKGRLRKNFWFFYVYYTHNCTVV